MPSALLPHAGRRRAGRCWPGLDAGGDDAIRRRAKGSWASSTGYRPITFASVLITSHRRRPWASSGPWCSRIVAYTRELGRIATTDPLTGALNRRGFTDRAARRTQHAAARNRRRYSPPAGRRRSLQDDQRQVWSSCRRHRAPTSRHRDVEGPQTLLTFSVVSAERNSRCDTIRNGPQRRVDQGGGPNSPARREHARRYGLEGGPAVTVSIAA